MPLTMYLTMPLIIRSFILGVFLSSMSLCFADAKLDLIKLAHKPNAPEFSLPDMKGQLHKLSDFRGKPVIVSLWATWCPPCRAEIPFFNRAWEKLKDDDVGFLFININEGLETIEAYKKEHPIHLTILRDETAGQLNNWNITGLPTTFIIDPQGRVVYQAMGEKEWDNDQILNKIRALKDTDNPNKSNKIVNLHEKRQINVFLR